MNCIQLLIYSSELFDLSGTIKQSLYKDCYITYDNKNIFINFKEKDNIIYDYAQIDILKKRDIVLLQILNIE